MAARPLILGPQSAIIAPAPKHCVFIVGGLVRQRVQSRRFESGATNHRDRHSLTVAISERLARW
jgi:hypothetical protein